MMNKSELPEWFPMANAGTNEEPFVVAFMCMTDFSQELGRTSMTLPVHSSVEDLVDERACALRCGIVEVEVRVRHVVPPEEYRYFLDSRVEEDESPQPYEEYEK